MAIELIDVLKRLAENQGTNLAFQVERHNMEVWEIARAKGKSPPAANEEERKGRRVGSGRLIGEDNNNGQLCISILAIDTEVGLNLTIVSKLSRHLLRKVHWPS
jgi:hypothetical protein